MILADNFEKKTQGSDSADLTFPTTYVSKIQPNLELEKIKHKDGIGVKPCPIQVHSCLNRNNNWELKTMALRNGIPIKSHFSM